MRKCATRIRESRFRAFEGHKVVSHAALTQDEVFRIVVEGPSFSPDQLLKELEQISRIKNPSVTVLQVLSRRAVASSHLFYPPQVVSTIDIFSKISFCDPKNFFDFLVSRKTDLLANASPKRIVSLVEAITRLNLPLFHDSLWPEIRDSLIHVLPQLKRGVPCLLASLARAGCTDSELIEALLVHAECVKTEIEPEFFIKAIEAASRIHDVSKTLSQFLRTKQTPKNSCLLYTAATRSDVDVAASEYLEQINAYLSANSSSLSLFEKGRLLELVGRFGLKADSKMAESVAACIEEGLSSNSDFSHKFLPHSLLSAAVIGGNESTVCFALSALVKGKRHIRMSAEKLLALIRAGRIVGVDAKIVTELKETIAPIKSQLGFRHSRLLWEVCPSLTTDSTALSLPPLTRRGREGDAIKVESVGPYSFTKEEGEVLIPAFQVQRPNRKNQIRPDALLRLEAIQSAANRPVVYSHSFSDHPPSLV